MSLLAHLALGRYGNLPPYLFKLFLNAYCVYLPTYLRTGYHIITNQKGRYGSVGSGRYPPYLLSFCNFYEIGTGYGTLHGGTGRFKKTVYQYPVPL